MEASCSRKAGFRRAWPPCWVKTSICLAWGPQCSLLGLKVTKQGLCWGWREASPHAHHQKMFSISEWVVCLGEEEVQPPCYHSHFQPRLDRRRKPLEFAFCTHGHPSSQVEIYQLQSCVQVLISLSPNSRMTTTASLWLVLRFLGPQCKYRRKECK